MRMECGQRRTCAAGTEFLPVRVSAHLARAGGRWKEREESLESGMG